MPRPWSVLPHRPIEKLQPNLWTVEADLPQGPIKRRMGIARLADGRLVFLNAIALDEPSMVQIEAWGEPAFAIAGNLKNSRTMRLTISPSRVTRASPVRGRLGKCTV